ncbi:GTP cyclohydrolase I FolE, partial [Campylobacter jejuni]|nr:GTP cyclohydrolase I FolE [Campylobacter jejuni]
NSTTTTSALRGIFLKNEKTREEFFSLINSAKQVRF